MTQTTERHPTPATLGEFDDRDCGGCRICDDFEETSDAES